MRNKGKAHQRTYAGAYDLQAILDLVRQRPCERAADYPSLTDIQEMMGVSQVQAGTSLWESADGELVGFAILEKTSESASLAFETLSEWKGTGLEDQIIAWADEAGRKVSGNHRGSFYLESSSRSDNPERVAVLKRFDFRRLKEGTVHMEGSLVEIIAPPQLPPGFTIRPLAGGTEAEAWVGLHRAAWCTEYMSLEYKLAMMQTPDYHPEMDLVAVTEKGELVAYCVCFISKEENALTGRKDGYTDPIATHPDFQRRGLAKALMLQGMQLLKSRGMTTARLGTSSENIAMIRTAESVGFHVIARTSRYRKTIRIRQTENGNSE